MHSIIHRSLFWLSITVGTVVCIMYFQTLQAAPKANNDYRLVEWPELIPKADYDALMNPPDYLNDIEDGSMEDQITLAIAQASDDSYQQALVSTRIKPEFDQQKVRIPGFIVPLEFNEDQKVTHFFLVPYFGACIHMPPPPPNQIIYGTFPDGKQVDNLYDAFWLEGKMETEVVENELGTSAYSMSVDSITLY